MPGIIGMANTYNTPNFVGELFAVTPTDTPFLSAIDGLTGGEDTTSTTFQWQAYDLRSPDAHRQRLEGAAPPDPEHRVRWNVRNIVEIHQEAIDVSYTKQAAIGQYASTGSPNRDAAGLAGANPVTNEVQFQIQRQLEQIARDIEVSFLTGRLHEPVDNTEPRRTRGLLDAIETNTIRHPEATPLSETMVLDLCQSVWENGGIQVSDTATLLVNAWQKRQLTELFITRKHYRELSRTVGGVAVQTIETDFGQLGIMLDRHMPRDTLALVSLEQCTPVFLRIPDRGFLFVEPLAKTGSRDDYQLYGEIGLKWGNERAHGTITGLTAGPAAPKAEAAKPTRVARG
ncbi:SU10 major capsid protein [Saccharopolyspora hattusasensis]|uniref:SU10 major capsid protein n=1 Tax=Saccharopolyspora hattusasensis TaxID=1128679 RepID=UPI003D97419B